MGVGVGGHVGRGGACFTMDFCKIPMDLGGCLACGFDFLKQILHIAGLEMTFWNDFHVILHGFAPRISQNTLKLIKAYILICKLDLDQNMYKHI